MTDLYSFAFRGLLTEEALDKAGRVSALSMSTSIDADVARRLPLDALAGDMVARATRMATVYIAIAAFENTVRDFVITRLLEEVGADWWIKAVSEKIRTKAETRREEEKRVRWHSPRGDDPINYTEFGDLSSIVTANWPHFEDLVHSQDWMRNITGTIERSRNVIMHSGELSLPDVERVGVAIRDWIRQIGA